MISATFSSAETEIFLSTEFRGNTETEIPVQLYFSGYRVSQRGATGIVFIMSIVNQKVIEQQSSQNNLLSSP